QPQHDRRAFFSGYQLKTFSQKVQPIRNNVKIRNIQRTADAGMGKRTFGIGNEYFDDDGQTEKQKPIVAGAGVWVKPVRKLLPFYGTKLSLVPLE
ncbi:MAG: hypothetical protein QGF59_32925, partial [Pirellulaceae bacterium]|nr:hypothetical protein [Pirellulaceae bacterium]